MRIARWESGDPAVQAAVEAWLVRACQSDGPALAASPRRRLLRLDAGACGELLVKQHHTGTGRHRGRERVKRWAGGGPAAREYRALVRLRAAGVSVPEPLALGRLVGGDHLVVLRFEPGDTLDARLARPGVSRDAQAVVSRRARLDALGELVARLHASGHVHGDLHGGNVLIGDSELMLLDLQHARATTSPRARRRDLARLDHSLWMRGLSVGDRLRVRSVALGYTRPFDPAARRALRSAGLATLERLREHARSREGRALREGRRFVPLSIAQGDGMRRREIDARTVQRALDEHHAALEAGDERLLDRDRRAEVSASEIDDRRLVVKRTRSRGVFGRVADLWRGSPARRAWTAGYGLEARRIGAATPLAFVEKRRFGLTAVSAVVLEDLRPGVTADRPSGDPERDARTLVALGRLLAALHERGATHLDLKASNVILGRDAAGAVEPRLLDLEDVRFPRRLRERDRIRSLAQLNASLPDTFRDGDRLRALALYAARLPFASGRSELVARVVAASLARRHRWSGATCAVAREAGVGPAAGRLRSGSG